MTTDAGMQASGAQAVEVPSAWARGGRALRGTTLGRVRAVLVGLGIAGSAMVAGAVPPASAGAAVPAGHAAGAAPVARAAQRAPVARAAGADPALVTPPSRRHGGWVAKILRTTSARSFPGSKRKGWPVQTTVTGGHFAQELLVLRRDTVRGKVWLQVRLPKRPNDADGWIPADATRLRHTDDWVRVRTASRTVSVYRNGRLTMQMRAVVGAPSTPTPHGLFAVLLAARQADPHGFLGPWALHLTAHSNVLDNYGGGPGRVAIHGRDGASLLDPLGTARSHGCIRIENRAITRLVSLLRPGTPVRVTS